jgi:probable rRNA maturation factor
MPESVQFFSEGIRFTVPGKRVLRRWIESTIRSEKFVTGQINMVICTDSYLLKINRKYLKKDTLTDIITFGMAEEEYVVSGDIFISLERVRENAHIYKEQVKKELARVMIHGVLHLMGYDDESESEKKVMRKKENFYLKDLLLW